MSEAILSTNEQIEIVRKAVMKRGGSVTVGDIISETGLDTDTAKSCLNQLIKTHEGTLRVSSTGELLYAFAPGVVLRDQRTWWERNKEAVLTIVKKLFKIIIFLVLVIYFILYMIILFALLANSRGNNRNSINFNGIIWFFWGRGYDDRSYEGKWNNTKREPIYTRVYNFVFGPEEPKIDPLEARTKCAQLIRAKKGIITLEDWMVVSGQSREKCESDLARYTAEFDGSAEILDDGTLVYVFEDVMKSMQVNQSNTLPAPAWTHLEKPKKLTANEGAGNALVIGLNSFNLIMAFLLWKGIPIYQETLANQAANGRHLDTTDQLILASSGNSSTLFWLAIFPLIFSALIFAGPLVRLPSHRKENRERRQRSLHKALLAAIFDDKGTPVVRISKNSAISRLNMTLNKQGLEPASTDEFQKTMNLVCDELGGELDISEAEQTYVFRDMKSRINQASQYRRKRALDDQSMGRVIFSSDNSEQDEIDQNNMADELDDFDRALQGDAPSSGYSQTNQNHAAASFDINSYLHDSRQNKGRNNNHIDYLGR